MKSSNNNRSYNDLLRMIEHKMNDEAKVPSEHDVENDESSAGSRSEKQQLSHDSYSDFTASNIPKNLLCALADETFARRSSFMSSGKMSVGDSIDEPQIDIEREKTKMESFECYILVSVLTATASFSTLQDFTPLDDNGASMYCQILLIITQIIAGLSTICGLYATVVFSLTVLYAKSAIGLNRDATYSYFLKETGMARVRGFRAFSISLLSFAIEAALVTFLRLPTYVRFPILFVTVGVLRLLGNDWLLIVDKAGVIYSGVIPNESVKDKTE